MNLPKHPAADHPCRELPAARMVGRPRNAVESGAAPRNVRKAQVDLKRGSDGTQGNQQASG